MICNSYLNDKRFIIDGDSLKLKLNNGQFEYLADSMFSSGDKQIVSIFFYLIFQEKEYFVIIDEPELSVSMFWQEKILLDILNANCSGILVATHSPFIFKNTLRKYTMTFDLFKEKEI